VKFNSTYCSDFDPGTGEGGALRLPEPQILKDAATVMGVDGRKMSKSYDNTIELFGTDKQLKKSVMRIVTDSTPLEAPKDPDQCNVYALLELVSTPEELEEIRADYRRGGVGYGDFKKRLLEKIHVVFDDARARHAQLEADPGYVQDVLETGARRAREVGAEVLDGVQRACGLRA
jgi:tryptophanyl-tRNA synthetase